MEQVKQKIQITKVPLVELAIRLSCFYKNEIMVKYIIKTATHEGGYDNKNGLVITYSKDEKCYIIISSNNEYNYLTRIIDRP